MNNIVQFSDLVQKKLAGVLLAKVDTGTDELGNTVINADIGPLEVSIYTSQDDGAMIVQIDSPTLEDREHPTLRVYLNDTTLYSTNIDESDDDSTPEGA